MEQEMETKVENNIEMENTEKSVEETQVDKVEDTKTKSKKMTKMNLMQEIEIEKMVLHCGGTDDKLEKSIKLLEMITGSKKVYVVQSTRRIPTFGISPGKKSGAKITLRDKTRIHELLERFFVAVDNIIKRKQITTNQFCFGIPEYIEIPGMEYNRDIGITGFEVMLVFKRKGKSVKLRKIKRGKYPKRQDVTKEEIEAYMTKHFNLEVDDSKK